VPQSEPHQWKGMIAGKPYCVGCGLLWCGLLWINNLLTNWCIKKGCDHADNRNIGKCWKRFRRDTEARASLAIASLVYTVVIVTGAVFTYMCPDSVCAVGLRWAFTWIIGATITGAAFGLATYKPTENNNMTIKTIEVTAEDINKGFKQSCSNCPVALAMTRALGYDVTVGATTWRYADSSVRSSLPKTTQDFIALFDQGEPVTPHSFFVEDLD
jgi:hypothetical protein